MNRYEYQIAALRTKPNLSECELRTNAIMGLIGEAGEVVDCLKKWRFQSVEGTPVPFDDIVKEIGDVYWYCALLCHVCGIDLGDIYIVENDPNELRNGLPGYLCSASIICARYAALLSEKYSDDAIKNTISIMLQLYNSMLDVIGSSGEQAMERNIEKLMRRYPHGFDPDRSMNRAEQ